MNVLQSRLYEVLKIVGPCNKVFFSSKLEIRWRNLHISKGVRTFVNLRKTRVHVMVADKNVVGHLDLVSNYYIIRPSGHYKRINVNNSTYQILIVMDRELRKSSRYTCTIFTLKPKYRTIGAFTSVDYSLIIIYKMAFVHL